MTASAFTAIPPFKQVFGGKDDVTLVGEVIVFGVELCPPGESAHVVTHQGEDTGKSRLPERIFTKNP